MEKDLTPFSPTGRFIVYAGQTGISEKNNAPSLARTYPGLLYRSDPRNGPDPGH
jgi:hypothetical protein